MYNPEIHHRRSIRLKDYDYSQEGCYFITICTHNKECLFGEIINSEMHLNKYGKVIKAKWLELPTRYPNIDLYEFVVMPNHFHGILRIANNSLENRAGKPRPYVPKLGNIIAYFKYQTTKHINLSVKLWQRNYYEHIIRDARSYDDITNYIKSNPERWLEDSLHP